MFALVGGATWLITMFGTGEVRFADHEPDLRAVA